ncbi:hypothetical protein [Roseibium salinum]|uniref:Uncharacterized protein n=1 Tax=Roseibium salinum TaxID=1604349 RepID=A0ABT3R7M2_9HYPH|nr:hypothetical protein [Roseibium sp. DSM 29163]MCX2725253.1 hypothetical protein [Roseibium sp. DSM 29163]
MFPASRLKDQRTCVTLTKHQNTLRHPSIRKANAAYASLPSIPNCQRTEAQNLSSTCPQPRENQPEPNLAIRPFRTNFQEFRAQNPVASDVAAVDERGYTHTNQTSQRPNHKKSKKTQKQSRQSKNANNINGVTNNNPARNPTY